MSSKLNFFCAVAALACLISSGANAANLLTDGSFESDMNFQAGGHPGDEQLGHGSADLAGWTVVGVGQVGWFSNANGYDITASDGGYSLDLTGDTDGAGGFGGIQQSVQTVAGATYHLTFDLGSDQQYGVPVSLQVSADGANGSFTSTLVNTDNPNANIWAHEDFQFVAAGSTTVITLQATGGQHYIGLDNVILDGPAGGGSVPEPMAWSMMLLGFGGIGSLLRAKRTPARGLSL